MKYYGNLALQPERKPAESAPAARPSQARPRRRQLPVGEKLLYLFTVVLLVVIASVVIYRYAEIYQINRDIQKLNQEYEMTVMQIKELKKEVEKLSDPATIVEKATALGMVKSEDRGIAVAPDSGRTATAMKQP